MDTAPAHYVFNDTLCSVSLQWFCVSIQPLFLPKSHFCPEIQYYSTSRAYFI